MYAIIATGGKQYKVSKGDIVTIEKLDLEIGAEVSFEVLMISGDAGVEIGKPIVAGKKVSAKVVQHGKGEKVVIFKYKPKKDYRKSQGHRQPFTKVQIVGID